MHEDGRVGVIFAFGKQPSIGQQVEDVATIFAKDTGLRCSDTELIVYEDCPSEVDDHIFVQLFNEPCDPMEVSASIRKTLKKPTDSTDHRTSRTSKTTTTKWKKKTSADDNEQDDDDDDSPSPPPRDGGSPVRGGGGGGSDSDDGGSALKEPVCV